MQNNSGGGDKTHPRQDGIEDIFPYTVQMVSPKVDDSICLEQIIRLFR
jgi:hypothetical protein